MKKQDVPNPPRGRYRYQAVFLAAFLGGMTLAATAATPVLSFDFNETSTDAVKDSVSGLVGTVAGEAPTSVTDSPSGQAGDRAIHFDAGQYITVDDPSTKMQLDPANPSFTLQAWVKFSGNPSGRQVFFYSNGPGGAISFSVNTDRTVFVTTLGILDASSSAAIPDDGAWHHIAVVHENGKELRYYVDGVLGDTRAYTSGVIFTRTQTFFSLGAEATGGLQYIGSLDRLKVTSGILTPEQFDSKPVTAPIVDTDKDGMPDDWETKYGLNPNDASDAAKDLNGNGITNLDEFKKGLDPTDTTKPAVVSASTSSSFDTVKITFSKDLDPTTATNVANYSISPSLAVTGASYKGKVVTLTTAKQTPGGTAYTVTVTGVKDVSNFAVPAESNKATFFSYLLATSGVLRFSYWGAATGGDAIGGTAVDGLTGDPRYPASPDLVLPVYSLNSRDAFPDDSHENYGATIDGYLTPTESARYRFFLRSDDASQFWISTDDKEANLAQVAEEAGCCNAFTEPDSPRTSEPIALVAGKKYFIRLIYKEGGGGDYGQVAWRKEGDTTSAAALLPIPGKFLSSAVEMPFPSEGAFFVQIPGPNAKNIGPDSPVQVVHIDGKTPWSAANTSLKLDGTAVIATFSKEGNVGTLTYQAPAIFAPGSVHTVELGYPQADGSNATMTWSFTVTNYKNIALPQPLFFEDFEKYALGTVPTGWTLTNNTDSLNAGLELGDPKSDSYLDWVVIDRNQVFLNGTNEFHVWEAGDPDGRVTHIAPGQVVNNAVLKASDLMVGKFLFAESDERGSSQEQTAFSPIIDLTGKTNIWLSFHSSYIQNQDSIGVVEYSIDGGTSWLPVLYMLDGPDIVHLPDGSVDAVTTLTQDEGDTAHAQPYGAFLGAPISQDLAPFISARINDDNVESHRVELFPLPKADNQSKVQLRFMQAGTGSWYFGIDNVGVYSLSAVVNSSVSASISRSGNSLTIQWAPTGGTLETSTALGPTATWTAVGTANPATITVGAGSAFYRVRK